MANPKAQAFKEKGNAAFKAGDYPTAIGHYTSAILADRNDVTFPLNRAAAYLKLGKYEDTERDCNTVLTISAPKTNVKALFRRGQARVGLGKLLEAQKDFTDVLAQEASNTSASDELKTVTILIQNEKAKKSKVIPSSIPSRSTASNPEIKRRRVPIRIVGDTTGESTSAADVNGGSTSKVVSTPKPIISPGRASPSAPSTTHVPKAKIIETSPPSSPMDVDPKKADTPRKSTSTPASATAPPGSSNEMLQAVSSRSLKSPSPTTRTDVNSQKTTPAPASKPTKSTPTSTTAPTSSTSTTSTSTSTPTPPQTFTSPPASQSKPKQDSFKDAKQARDAKAPRVGGGIFRASGSNTIFPSRGGASPGAGPAPGASEEMEIVSPSVDESTSSVASTNEAQPTLAPAGSSSHTSPPSTARKDNHKNTPPPPATLFEFSKTWYGIKSPWEKWAFLNTIPPAQFPGLCKTSLEPSLLVSILDIFLTILTTPSATTEDFKVKVQEYMENFAHISRFSTLVLFLSKPEKAVAREVWNVLGVDKPERVWKAVGNV